MSSSDTPRDPNHPPASDPSGTSPYGQPPPYGEPTYGQSTYGQSAYGQPTQPWQGSPQDSGTTSDERNWAMAAHLGSFVAAWAALGLLAGLAVLLVKGNDSAFVRRHAVESLNFNINACIYTVVFFVLIFVGIGLILLPLYGLFYFFCVVSASVRASKGEDFRYPLTVRFVS